MNDCIKLPTVSKESKYMDKQTERLINNSKNVGARGRRKKAKIMKIISTIIGLIIATIVIYKIMTLVMPILLAKFFIILIWCIFLPLYIKCKVNY